MTATGFRRLQLLWALQPAAGQSAHVPRWVHLLWLLVLLATDALQMFSFHKDALVGASSAELLIRLLYDLVASAVFYANWVLLIPRTLSRGRLGPYILGVLGLLLAYVPLRAAGAVLLQSLAAPAGPSPRSTAGYIIPYTIFGLMIVFLSSALKVTGDYLREQRNRRELERQQLLTELSLLKMQVNPHFLFNTLNNIFVLASQKSDRAPEAVLRLAEIMRYMLYESSADTVPLTQELKHLRGFLDLQRLRLPGNAAEAVVFDYAGGPGGDQYPIAPMLLLPLVENAFKHGDLTARPAVVIQLEIGANDELRFRVRNQVAPDDRRLPHEPGGVGLTNLRRRLELLYPGRYHLELRTPAGEHQVTLTLQPA
ncbi:sensor histidine kinase [Hymenobacter sp. B81]|uniref:sensor histidine kinase n=1 Tax=Hymenobacter sp. B81 TaxID=3344878 RepID=UPI0037DCB78D